MKKQWILGAGAAAVLAIVPVQGAPAIAHMFNAGTAIAQNVLRQPKVNLHLVADQQVVKKDAQGNTIKTWQPIDTKVTAKSGDVIRFTVNSKNEGNREAKNFALTQPVPKGTIYQLNSATVAQGMSLTYSIDQGKTFIANPTVKVTLSNGTTEERPAPAAAYTHVRWSLAQAFQPDANVSTSYQVTVR